MSKFIVGITGGIASGKTAVSDMLKSRGFAVVDADEISREITSSGGIALPEIKKAFPNAFMGENLNREVLREEVFNNKEKLNKLNAIMHPLIHRLVFEKIEELNDEIIILVVPLLFETGYDKDCDYIVTVVSDEKTRINRIKDRNNSITDGVAKSMIKSQYSDGIKVAKSNTVINNDGDLIQLRQKVDELEGKIKAICEKH